MQRTNRRAYDRSDCIIVTCVIDRLHDSFFRIVGVPKKWGPFHLVPVIAKATLERLS